MRYRALLRGQRERLETSLLRTLPGDDLLGALRAFVAEGRAQLLRSHRAGAPERETLAALSGLTDAVVRALFGQAVVAAGLSSVEVAACALVALGGYGRRELHPASDVDLTLLFRERDDAYLRALTEHLFHALVELRFDLGYAYRAIPDCLGLADADHRSLSSPSPSGPGWPRTLAFPVCCGAMRAELSCSAIRSGRKSFAPFPRPSWCGLSGWAESWGCGHFQRALPGVRLSGGVRVVFRVNGEVVGGVPSPSVVSLVLGWCCQARLFWALGRRGRRPQSPGAPPPKRIPGGPAPPRSATGCCTRV